MNKLLLRVSLAALLAAPGASLAQNLTGTVLAGDTGAPIPGAIVLAVGVTSSPAQAPAMYQTRTDASGKYSLTAPGGQYRLCVSGAGSYLNPCLWGGATTEAAGAPAATVRLQKGAMFIARVHAPQATLTQAETVHGGAVAAHVLGGPFAKFLLPVVYESATVRDYGEVLPLNFPLTLVLTSSHLALKDFTGAALPALGSALTITASDFTPSSLFAVKVGGAPQTPTAKMVHYYATP